MLLPQNLPPQLQHPNRNPLILCIPTLLMVCRREGRRTPDRIRMLLPESAQTLKPEWYVAHSLRQALQAEICTDAVSLPRFLLIRLLPGRLPPLRSTDNDVQPEMPENITLPGLLWAVRAPVTRIHSTNGDTLYVSHAEPKSVPL
jgi:hypothetical protein